MPSDSTHPGEGEKLAQEIERLKAENARLRKENNGLSAMVRATGGRSSGGAAKPFLLGLGVGLILAYVTMLMWSSTSIGGPFIRMF